MLSKKLLLLLSIYIATFLQVAESSSCNNEEPVMETIEKECTSTEYTSYVDCIRKRSKRHIDCMSSCDDNDGDCGNDNCGQCDCNFCSYNDCDANCQTCCSSYSPPCATRTCCHATCQSSCRSSSCRRSCRTRCNKSLDKEKIYTSGSSSGSSASKSDTKVDIQNQARHNITTVINLKTIVNNTNIVDMPIMLNNTNTNNITLQSPEQGDINVNMQPGHNVIQVPSYQPPIYPPSVTYPPPDHPSDIIKPPPEQNCCNLISPRQCVPTESPPYSRCYHTKTKTCGDICQAAIMHEEPHRVCENNEIQGHVQSQCHQQVSYIPQPQPRCFSTSGWPYVSCTIAKPSCGGCYTHLVQGGSAPNHCPNSCYEGGINVGPYYRPGPYYQQQYAIPQMCGSGGCYGSNQMGMEGNPDAGFALESIGATFNHGPQDVTLEQQGQQGPNGQFIKKKRNSEDINNENEKSNSVDYKTEEFHI